MNLPAYSAGAPPMPTYRLRVGAIVDSLEVPAWVKHILEQIDGAECHELTLLVCNDASVRRSAWNNLQNQHISLLFRAWAWLDYCMLSTRIDKPNAVEIGQFTPKHGTPQLLHRGQQEQSFGPPLLNAIRNAEIDVLLDFTGTATHEVADCARFGLWSLETEEKVVSALFREMCEGRPELEVSFNLTRKGTMEGLACLRFATDFMSLFRNYNRYRWSQAEAVTRTLTGLQRCGSSYVQERLRARKDGTCVLASNGRMVGFLLRSLRKTSGVVLERAFLREDWFIAYRQSCPLLVPETEPTQFVVVRAPRGRWYADPFVVERGGRTFIFFEDYSFIKRKAVISVIEIDAASNPGEPEVVLDVNYHVSYPCVFEWKGEMYMLPETKDNRTIELYVATDFPRGWRRKGVLMTGVSTVDSTILEYDGKFWLFTSGLNKSEELFSGDSELYLFFSSTPVGPWEPHPKNPIVTDVRRCRPAGLLFFEDGQLIRPSQDCSGRYGRAVSLNRVDLLSQTDYAETPIATIAGNWIPRNIGTHTFNQSSQYQVIDGRTLVSRIVPRPSRQPLQFVKSKGMAQLASHP